MDDPMRIREVPMPDPESGDPIREGGWQKAVVPPKTISRPPGMTPPPGTANAEPKKEGG